MLSKLQYLELGGTVISRIIDFRDFDLSRFQHLGQSLEGDGDRFPVNQQSGERTRSHPQRLAPYHRQCPSSEPEAHPGHEALRLGC